MIREGCKETSSRNLSETQKLKWSKKRAVSWLQYLCCCARAGAQGASSKIVSHQSQAKLGPSSPLLFFPPSVSAVKITL